MRARDLALLRRGRSLLLAALAAEALAQQQPPRWHLPREPYDYAAVAAPAGMPGLSLPARYDPALRQKTNARATLGRVLFYDPLLSRNGTRSCGSCHQQRFAFADGRAHSVGFAGARTPRNAMAIANLYEHQGGFFWDARARTLEEMVLLPIQNPIEMGLDLDTLVDRVIAAADYVPLFAAAFGDPGVNPPRIACALATFVRAITSHGSRYDRELAAAHDDVDRDFAGFTAAENRGKRLFFGTDEHRGDSCASCHVSFGGCCWSILEPGSLDSGACSSNGIDAGHRQADAGRGAVTGDPLDRGLFRAPSLRNIELTGPYMHDGRFARLEDVVDFYATRFAPRRHERFGPVPTPPPAASSTYRRTTDPPDQFAFSTSERADLVAFLKTLTDWPLVRDPRFGDPFRGS
jgi:cytochrome c peroxidase